MLVTLQKAHVASILKHIANEGSSKFKKERERKLKCTKGQKNKICSKAPTNHNKHIKEGKGKETRMHYIFNGYYVYWLYHRKKTMHWCRIWA